MDNEAVWGRMTGELNNVDRVVMDVGIKKGGEVEGEGEGDAGGNGTGNGICVWLSIVCI